MESVERFSAAAWSDYLSHELSRAVEVRFGRARHNVIVARPAPKLLEVRMNEHFAFAPAEIRESVALWLRSGRRAPRACERLDRWIAQLTESLGPRPRRRVRLETSGEHHDLAALSEELLASEFTHAPLVLERHPAVTWGRRGARRVKRSLELGSFDPETRIVRVHPVLDQPFVPRFFVRYVLFHELLHAALDGAESVSNGRRRHHGPRFRAAERVYVDYERALEWQQDHVGALIRSARTGRPVRSLKRRVREVIGQAWLFPELG